MIEGIFHFIWKHPWLLIVVSLLLMYVTGSKMHKMAQIRGWVPGATLQRKIVTDMKMSESSGRGRGTFWISWDNHDARKVGPHRMNLPEDAWKRISVGDAIEFVRVPGDSDTYYRDGIFASDGNFVFDICLLCFELFLFVAGVYRLAFSDQDEEEDSFESDSQGAAPKRSPPQKSRDPYQ